ncbi:hypothetical protein Tco_0221602, partial [Tanacetum coccineum]
MSVLHCMMMSHGGKLLARYRGLNQSHHEYVLSVDSRLKGYEEKVASLTRLERQVSTWKKQVSGLNDKLSSSDAFFEKSKAKGKERKKKIKSLTKSLDNLQAKVARLSADLNRATVLEAEKDEEILRELLSLVASVGFERGLSMHRTKDEFAAVLKKMAHFVPGAQGWLAKAPLVAQTDYAFLNKISEFSAEPLTVILQLELEKLVCPANFPTSKDARVSPPIVKESTVTPAFESFELSANVVPALSVVALEQNEEWGISHVLDDVAEVTVVGSGRVSSDLTDVVVALFAGEKGDGSLPSSATDEEAIANRYGFRLRANPTIGLRRESKYMVFGSNRADTIQLEGAVSTISGEYLLEFTTKYGIPKNLHPEVPGLGETIVDFPEGKVDERIFLTAVDWRASAPRDEMPITGSYSASDVTLLNTHRAPFQRLPENLLCLVGLSRNYYLGDDVYPTFLHDDDREMDLFSLIRNPNPFKVKTGTRPRAAHEVPLLTATTSRVIDMEDPTVAFGSSRTPSTIERSPLDFDNEDPAPSLAEEAGAEEHVQEGLAHENPYVETTTTTEVVQEAMHEEEVAATEPPVNKRRKQMRRKRVNEEAEANAPPKVLRKDHASGPTHITHRGKSLAA